jgi:hypothetical protein
MKKNISRSQFYNLAGVHDCHPAARFSDHRHIVRNQDESQVEFRLQSAEQVKYLALGDDVKGSSRLIRDDE